MLGVDPGWVLDQPVEDLPIVQAMLEAASKMRTEYDESFAKAIAAETANRILPGLSKQITRLAAALARSRRL
jgi:hypothetical protein